MNKLVLGDFEFGNKFPKVSKGEFYDSKIGLKLSSVDVGKIAVSNKIKVNDDISSFYWLYCG